MTSNFKWYIDGEIDRDATSQEDVTVNAHTAHIITPNPNYETIESISKEYHASSNIRRR